MKQTKIEDFRCQCGCKENNFVEHFLEAILTVECLLPFRPRWTSGCRCDKYNKKVGGSLTSSHLKGLAVDGKYDSSQELAHLIMMIIVVCNIMHIPVRIGIYNGYIHWDMDRTKTNPCIWRG